MPNPTEIQRRFTFKPPTEETKPLFEAVTFETLALAHKLDEMIPEGREKALALTALQEVRFWANAAIATCPAKKD